jgi:cell division control protein 12
VNLKPTNNKLSRLPQLIAERDRLNKDLEMAHSAIKSLEAELDNLQAGYGRGSARR